MFTLSRITFNSSAPVKWGSRIKNFKSPVTSLKSTPNIVCANTPPPEKKSILFVNKVNLVTYASSQTVSSTKTVATVAKWSTVQLASQNLCCWNSFGHSGFLQQSTLAATISCDKCWKWHWKPTICQSTQQRLFLMLKLTILYSCEFYNYRRNYLSEYGANKLSLLVGFFLQLTKFLILSFLKENYIVLKFVLLIVYIKLSYLTNNWVSFNWVKWTTYSTYLAFSLKQHLNCGS